MYKIFFFDQMGRSIPSFRQLIEIERLNWSEFKKELPSKVDKELFDTIFENATQYTQYLSSANRPVPIEPIMMGALFHNYKALLKLNSESKLSEDSLIQKVVRLEKEKPLVKALFDQICQRWDGLLYSLHKEDREQLQRMLIDCYRGLNERTAKTVMNKDSETSISVLFLFCLVLQHQKLIIGIQKSVEKNLKLDVTRLDYID